MSLIIIIGRGHSGTRIMSRTLLESGVYMGARLNSSYDLVPPHDMYEACRVMSRNVIHLEGLNWDFSKLHTMPIDDDFTRLLRSYLVSVLKNNDEHKGWKLPETTLVLPWIVRMFPDAFYIYWVRDPRDSIIGGHVTDDLADFNIPYARTDSVREMRAISWKYQREIVAATPKPAHWLQVRFEDFVLEQEHTLKTLEDYLGFPLVRVSVDPKPIGRWRNDTESNDFDFLGEDMVALGYQ
jgi:hypothetical protein